MHVQLVQKYNKWCYNPQDTTHESTLDNELTSSRRLLPTHPVPSSENGEEALHGAHQDPVMEELSGVCRNGAPKNNRKVLGVSIAAVAGIAAAVFRVVAPKT